MPAPSLGQAGLKRGKTSTGERAYVITAKGERLGIGMKGQVITPEDAQRVAEKAGVKLNLLRSKKANKQAKPETQPLPATQTTTTTEQKAKPLVSKAAVTAQDLKRKASIKKGIEESRKRLANLKFPKRDINDTSRTWYGGYTTR